MYVPALPIDFSFDMISDDREKAKQIFAEYTDEVNDHICLDINEFKKRITDEEARAIIKTIRQIEGLAGINRGIVLKA